MLKLRWNGLYGNRPGGYNVPRNHFLDREYVLRVIGDLVGVEDDGLSAIRSYEFNPTFGLFMVARPEDFQTTKGYRMAKEAVSPEPDVVALAKKYLRAKTDVCEELDEREFWDEEEAHDDELVERTHRQFLRKMKGYQKLLSAEFGEPAVVGKDEHDDIPRNGILEHAIWEVKGKSLFLAVSHEDTELPCLILLGVTRSN